MMGHETLEWGKGNGDDPPWGRPSNAKTTKGLTAIWGLAGSPLVLANIGESVCGVGLLISDV